MDIRRLDSFAPAWNTSHGRHHRIGRHGSCDDAQAAASTNPTQSNATSGAQLTAQLVTKQKGALAITTADGDKVSIRFKVRDAVSLALSSSTDASGNTTSSADLSVLSRGKLKIEVEGELDDGELAAIDDLLGKVDELAQRFFGGDVQDTFAAAADLQFDGEELAGFNLQLTYSQRLYVNQRAFALAAAPADGAPADALPDTPVTDAPASDAPAADAPVAAPVSADAVENAAVVADLPAAIEAAAPESAPESAPEAAAAAATPDVPVTDPVPVEAPAAEAPAAAPAPAANPKQTIVSYLRDVLGSLGSVQGTASMKFTMRWKLEFMAQALPALAPNEQAATSPATKLLTDALDKLAPPAA